MGRTLFQFLLLEHNNNDNYRIWRYNTVKHLGEVICILDDFIFVWNLCLFDK